MKVGLQVSRMPPAWIGVRVPEGKEIPWVR